MKKKLTKRMLLGVLAAAMFGISANDAEAQNFENTGAGTYNSTCRGVIRMKSTSGQIIPGTDQMGAIATKPIPGIVDWQSNAPAQQVQPYFYSLLVLSGTGTKTVLTGVNVVGSICSNTATDYLAGYTTAGLLDTYPYVVPSTGDITYQGTFNYSGSGDQVVYPQLDYNEIAVTNPGTTTFPSGQTVGAVNVTSTDDAPIEVAGTLNLGSGASDLQGDVTITAATGTLTVGGGDVTIGGDLALAGTLDIDNGATGLGTVNLDGTTTIATTGILQLGQTGDLVISGAITNAGDGTNLALNCASTITYDGAANPQLIMPTLDADGNRYGNLILSGGNKRGDNAAGYADNISVCTDFSLAGGNLDMWTNGGSLIMNAPTGTATYTDLAEVEGSMVRKTDGTGRAYTFNNSATNITLATVVTNPTSMTLNVRPGQNPDTYVGTTDVKRDINLAYAGNTGDFDMTVKAGYLQSEAADKSGVAEDWPAAYNEGQIRFYEANGAASEKVGTGEVYTKVASTGTTFGSVSLSGIGSISGATPTALPNGIGVFATGNDLVLRGGPTTFYSVQDGRWSNPNTWDEGTTPTSIDDVELRSTVFVGIDAPFINVASGPDGVAENNTKSEQSIYGNNSAANKITIASKVGLPVNANPALIIGNEDNGDNWIFKTELTTDNSIINNNANIPTTGLAAFVDGARTGIAAKGSYVAANPGFSGIWVTPWGATATNAPILQTQQIQNNAGVVNNEGIIEIGN